MSDASASDSSTTAGVFRRLSTAVERWIGTSRTAAALDTLTDRASVAVSESRIGSTAGTVGDWVRASRCYRWLTAEPDPDVIVIDLRETYTVGPIIRVLDRVLNRLAAAWDGSPADAATDAARDAPVRALGLVVTVAVLFETAVALALGGLTQSGLLARAVVFGLATLAAQVPLSAAELAETRTGRLLRAVLEPPEPREREESRERSDDRD